ncbi:MAG: glycosyltransferase [Usitatibacter sp.]
MARIAFAWELGGELGHAMSCGALAHSLAVRGHRIAFMFRELRSIAFLRETEGYDVFQAPVLLEEGRGAPIPVSYADVMLGCGYADAASLSPLVGAWRSLLLRWKPDLVVEDYSPTALLAAHTLGIPRVRFGNGFAIPPRASPLPSFRFDQRVPDARVAESDARALASANAVLQSLGAAPLARLADQLECDDEFLCTFPELDHYDSRGVAGYWGPRFQVSSGARVDWPAGGGKRIIVYLKTTLPQLDALIETLASSPHRVAAFVPDLDPGRRARLEAPRRIVSAQPLRLEPLLKGCDLLISNGGNLSPGSLTAGVPQMIFPTQYEQYITARRIEQAGCGLWLPQDAGPAQVRDMVTRMLADPRFLESARAFARRYAGFSPAEQRRRMVVRIEQILAARREPLPPGGGAPILSRSSTRQGP